MGTRDKYQKIIKEYTDSISFYDKKYMETGDPNFALFRDANIRTLQEIKEYVLAKEDEESQLNLGFDEKE